MFELVEKYLGFYFREAKEKLPFNSLDELIQHYRIDHFLYENYGEKVIFDDNLELMESSFNIAGKEDSMAAMRSLAARTEAGKVPSFQTILNSLSGQVESFTFQDAIEVTKDVGEKVAATAAAGIGLWAAKVVAGFILVGYLKKYLKA